MRRLMGTGTTLNGWIAFFRTRQHANDLHFVNEALDKLKKNKPSDALTAMKGEFFLEWANKFSKGTHETVRVQHQWVEPTTSACSGETGPDPIPEPLRQWGGEWSQQQEYVFLYDAYVALRDAVEADQPAPACVEADLQQAQADLIGFLLDDLENIRVHADQATSILSGV